MSGFRLAQGGLIDRGRPLRFRFEGRDYQGFAGDSLASALLANGVGVVGRSFKYHRPRGLLSAGVDEPNALMQLGEGAESEPNPPATMIELAEGLTARAVNCWPSLGFDLGALNGLFGRFLPAGFYYKTFMWPCWHLYEGLIRRVAGLGRAAQEPDPDRYDRSFGHCDVLVVGSGPAGLAAARAAAATGARVLLVEQDVSLGGSLLHDPARIDGQPGRQWVATVEAELRAAPEVEILTRTTAFGYFDHNGVALVQKFATSKPIRQRLWQIRAKQVVLATGALERPLVFPGNDRPGVMLAEAVRTYIGRYAVAPGRQLVLYTNNDVAYATLDAAQAAGITVAAIIDSRRTPPPARVEQARRLGIDLLAGGAVLATRGSPALNRALVRDGAGQQRWIEADILAMSGGRSPTVHLFSQSGGKLAWQERIAAFVPAQSVQAEASAGACAGRFGLAAALEDGHAQGVAAAERTGFTGAGGTAPVAEPLPDTAAIEPMWQVDAPGKAFVDFQSDVTTDDVVLSIQENFVSIEHLKRYTALGMATDQGKSSNVNALAMMAALTDRAIPDVGVTRFRPPYTPVALSAYAGEWRGELFRPVRRLALHRWHAAQGAVFEEYGGWLRPARYERTGEAGPAAEQREARAVRQAVGLFDGSPLGKIEVSGPDAATFLDRIYANAMSSLKIGRARYGLMLNELGVVSDDGVTARLAEDRFWLGTTGAGAGRIAAWLEEWLQCEWPQLRVLVAPVTTAWAVLTLSGPQARAVLAAAGTDIALGAAEFPHMTFRDGAVAGVPARIFRVSFTGEASYEINVATDAAETVWQALMVAGAAAGITPVGIDAWMLLRTEKGYLHIGGETDGTTRPDDIGWGHVLKREQDFVGRRSLTLPDAVRPDRPQFVGLEVVGSSAVLPVGAHLVKAPGAKISEGYVTSSGFSPVLGRGVALGMVNAGRSRLGEILEVATGGMTARVRITAPCAYDREGGRLHG
ncbi:MAG: sarcosine oxidase subunit alpha family protein [Aliidongia sp.]